MRKPSGIEEAIGCSARKFILDVFIDIILKVRNKN
jgi:hypothetical protein